MTAIHTLTMFCMGHRNEDPGGMKNAVNVSVAAKMVAIGRVDGCEDELTISLLLLLLLLS